MNRASTKSAVSWGLLLAMVVSGLTAVTDTGTIGLYGFAVLGMLVVGISLMWPERNRFFMGKSHPEQEDSRSQTRRPSAL